MLYQFLLGAGVVVIMFFLTITYVHAKSRTKR